MTDDIMNELEEDGAKPSTNLADVRALAMKQLDLEGQVARAEAALKKAQTELLKISDRELPAALKAAGIPSFVLDNGMKVAYKEDLKISLPKKNMDAILKNMRDWGYAANVSSTLTIDLGKGNDNAKKSLEVQATEMGLTVDSAETIAAGTVKKVLNQRIDEGKSDDLSLFGAFPFTRATVK